MNMDTTTEIAKIKQQLARQNRLLKLSLFGWVVGFSVLTIGFVPGLQDLKVRRLALVDKNGVERLILDTDNMYANFGSGEPKKRGSAVSGVILQNANGDEMGGFATLANGAAAVVLDSYSKLAPSGGADRVALFTTADGTAGLMLNDLSQTTRATITSGADLSAEFKLTGKDGLTGIHGKVGEDGSTDWRQSPLQESDK